jgi:hypothetical protein
MTALALPASVDAERLAVHSVAFPMYLRDDRLVARIKEHGRRCRATLALC